MFSPLAQFDIVCIVPIWLGSFDLSVTNLSLSVFFVLLMGYFFFIFLNLGMLVPSVWQNLLESIFLFVYSLVFTQLGKDGLCYFPFIFFLFTFMLMLNLLSMLPFGFAVTSHLVWTLYFSLSMGLGIFFLGLILHKIEFFKLFVPEVPLFLYPLMILIELMSYIMRLFSLAMSLSANLFAGHTLVHIISDAIFFLGSFKKIMMLVPFLLLLGIFVLELGVSCLQAYIFSILVCMYMNDSLHLGGH